jgi:regulator of RNase E activity RraA
MDRGKMLSLSVLEELRDFDTALLANTIDYIDPTPPHRFYLSGDIQSVTPSLGPTVGVAFTCELDSSTPNNEGDTEVFWQQLEAMQQYPLPAVWVVKTVGPRPEHECVIGDGMAKTLHSVGCVALVTNGRVRDVQGLLTTPFAAYCRGTVAHHEPLRFRAANQPVEVGGLVIHPGDVIHAGPEGVIRIPPECIGRLGASAVQMRAFEHKAHMALRRTDLSLAEKRKCVQNLLAEYGFSDCVSGGPRVDT